MPSGVVILSPEEKVLIRRYYTPSSRFQGISWKEIRMGVGECEDVVDDDLMEFEIDSAVLGLPRWFAGHLDDRPGWQSVVESRDRRAHV